MNTKCIGFLLLFLLLFGIRGLAQQYFRLLEQLDKPYEQKMARFSNGDVVVGGSPLTGKTSDQNGGINLTRLDKCGKVRWTLNYQWKQNYMKFKDLEINAADEVFVYGSAYEGFEEFIFLLKLSAKGSVIAFRVFHGGTVDNFTYNIQLKNNQLLAYGLLLDFNTSKRGFVFVFDEKLNFEWGKVFEPFESLGEAIITDDTGFLCRSGFDLVKLNAKGDFEWATTLETEANSGLYPVAGPLEVNDGYIFEAIYNDFSFFYKIDKNGKFVWKSGQFAAKNHAADLSLLADGNVLATYNCPGEDENFPCQLRLTSDGTIFRQQKLRVDPALQIASIYQDVNENGIVNIIGSTSLQSTRADSPAGFMLQYHLDSLSGKCFEWDIFQDVIPNEAVLNFMPLNIEFFKLNIRNVEARITATPYLFSFTESCDAIANTVVRADTLLRCKESWQVRLPNADFVWEDEVSGNPRTLTQAGVYRATDNNCISPVTYEFHVTTEPCACNVFLPTAFSPNNDGMNDAFKLFSNCKIQALQMTIYNRWGDRVFESDAINDTWNGLFKQKPVEAGVYIAIIRYALANEAGEMQEGTLAQNVLILK